MTTVMSGFLPETTGVQFTARPALRTRDGARTAMKNGPSSSIGNCVILLFLQTLVKMDGYTIRGGNSCHFHLTRVSFFKRENLLPDFVKLVDGYRSVTICLKLFAQFCIVIFIVLCINKKNLTTWR